MRVWPVVLACVALAATGQADDQGPETVRDAMVRIAWLAGRWEGLERTAPGSAALRCQVEGERVGDTHLVLRRRTAEAGDLLGVWVWGYDPARRAYTLRTFDRGEPALEYAGQLAGRVLQLSSRLGEETWVLSCVRKGARHVTVEVELRKAAGTVPRLKAEYALAADEVAMDQVAAYRASLRQAVERLQAGEFNDALSSLKRAGELAPDSPMVRLLTETASHLSAEPSEKMEQLIQAGEKLGALQGKIAREAGVVEFGRNLARKWRGEWQNAAHKARGDEAYNKEDWLTAYNEWRKITQRDSPFREAVAKNLDRVKDKIAEKFITEGDDAFAKGDADVAKQKYNAAIPFGSASLQSKILNKIQQVERDLENAGFLARAKEAFNTRNYEACIESLGRIPAESAYFKEAAALHERAQSILFEGRAKKLYRDGKGEEALALLRTAVTANLTTLREKIQAVFELYSKAKDLYDRQQYEEANAIWVALIKMEQDPENWYRIEAARRLKK